MIVFKMIVFGVEDDFSGALEEAGQYFGGAGFMALLRRRRLPMAMRFRGPPACRPTWQRRW